MTIYDLLTDAKKQSRLGRFVEPMGSLGDVAVRYLLVGEGALDSLGVCSSLLVLANLGRVLQSLGLCLVKYTCGLSDLGCPYLVGLELTCIDLGSNYPDTLRS